MDISTIHLEGNNAPVPGERDAVPTRVVGDVPGDLRGLFVRNGPNPRTGWSPHLFAGDGMVHGLWLDGAGAARYRNRYVRTPLFDDPATRRDGREVTTANTNVIAHAGRLLALEEGGLPYALDPQLETLGPFDFGGRLRGAMTAHPKRCPDTGELLFFGYGVFPPYLTYHRVGADGVLHSVEVAIDRPMMLHDFAVTSTQAVFVESPWVFELRARPNPWRWDASRPIRIGVLPRRGAGHEIRWYDLPSIGHLSHSANAYDDGDDLVLTGTRLASPDALPHAHEWRVRSGAGVVERALDDEAAEYPRIAEDRTGRFARFTYAASFELAAEPDHGTVYRYDGQTGGRTAHRFPKGHTSGEPVFVRRRDGREEDDGYVLTFVHDRATTNSYLAVLDATDISAAPIAEVHLPLRIPAGFHGNWVGCD